MVKSHIAILCSKEPYVLEIKVPYTKIVTAISKINCKWCIGDENLYN